MTNHFSGEIKSIRAAEIQNDEIVFGISASRDNTRRCVLHRFHTSEMHAKE
jgi:hypothetical protein